MFVGSPRTFRILAAVLALSGVGLLATASTAGASTGCGEYSFGFAGTRLLNDGISETAGPFAIELPAGTYDIRLDSHDAHDEHPGQDEQTQEQWYFSLDSGYSSPASHDVADDQNFSVTEFYGVEIPASTAITVHHLGEGGINSVDVLCVGFTPAKVAVPENVVPVEETEVEVAGPLPEQDEVIEEPVVEAVAKEVVPVEVKEVVEVASPPVAEVSAQVDPPAAAQLAVTGRTQQAAIGFILLSFALGMLLLGLSAAERKVS
ncbi:MAG: hypothetical protein R8J94_22765 [Acidimicrobiia bacterium]|nr:hypothetical protein [Acidimicrobiia bacterium]